MAFCQCPKHAQSIRHAGAYQRTDGRWHTDLELDYHSLEDVHNGGEAMTIFPKIKDMDPEKQKRVRANLLKYCGLDTYAMVKVLGKLYETVK